MKLLLIISSLVFITILSFGPEITPFTKTKVLTIGLKSDDSLETNRLVAKLKSQKSFSISLKNRTLKSALKELNASLDIKLDAEQPDDDFTFPFDFEFGGMNALEALDQILALRGLFGSFEKGSLIVVYGGYRC